MTPSAIVKYTICILLWSAHAGYSENLRCRRHQLEMYAAQADLEGRRCWDTIRINTCGGHCDSKEVADWLFPFKISKHFVCVHEALRPKSVILQNCDVGVTPGTEAYHYLDARTCACQICSSKNTSCEWLPPNSEFLRNLVQHGSERILANSEEDEFDVSD